MGFLMVLMGIIGGGFYSALAVTSDDITDRVVYLVTSALLFALSLCIWMVGK